MDVLEAIRNRRSVRDYSSEPIPGEVMEVMRRALRFAPSACNFQPWRFIFVMQAELRQELARVANCQLWMARAPVIVVACGYPEQAFKGMGGRGNSVDVDLAIALDHLTLAAVAQGLGTCWIGAFDEKAVKELLSVPTKVKVVAMTPLGYAASPEMNYPLDERLRKPPAEIFSLDRFENASDAF